MSLPTTPTPKSYLHTIPPRPIVDLVDRLTNRIEAGHGGRTEFSSNVAPTDGERNALASRAAELMHALAPAWQSEIEGRIGALLSGFPTYGADAHAAAMNARLIISALAKFPLWVLDEACRRVRDGVAGISPSKAPTAPELSQLCREIVLPVQVENGKIDRILRAKVYEPATEAERERVLSVVKGVVAELKAGCIGALGMSDEAKEAARIERLTPLDRQEHFQQEFSRLAGEFREAPPLASDNLRKIMGVGDFGVTREAAE
jgi:hypothetical protein